MDDAHAIRAYYEKAFLIDVQNPLGTVGRDWLPLGEELTIDTPEVIEVIPNQERLSFVSWDGADVDTPRGFIGRRASSAHNRHLRNAVPGECRVHLRLIGEWLVCTRGDGHH